METALITLGNFIATLEDPDVTIWQALEHLIVEELITVPREDMEALLTYSMSSPIIPEGRQACIERAIILNQRMNPDTYDSNERHYYVLDRVHSGELWRSNS